MENIYGLKERWAHLAVGAGVFTGAVVSRVGARFELLDINTLMGGNENRVGAEHAAVAMGLPLIAVALLDIFDQKIDKVVSKSIFFVYVALSANADVMDLQGLVKGQWEQLAADLIGAGLGIIALTLLDKLMKIDRREWTKEDWKSLGNQLKKLIKRSPPHTRD